MSTTQQQRPIPDWALQYAKRVMDGKCLPTDRLWKHPEEIFHKRRMIPDAWQIEALKSGENIIACCSRQVGKTELAGAIVLKTALLEAPATILLLSPTLRQSGEVFRDKFMRLYNPWRKLSPIVRESALTAELANGSRVISLPESEANIRGYAGVALIVIDEASRVSDELYKAVRPMLAVSGGRIMAMSTPYGRRGWFYEEWISDHPWKRISVDANQCPRINAAFLANEKATMGERWYNQEYFLSFADAVGQVFMDSDITAAFRDDIAPLNLFGEYDNKNDEPIFVDTKRIEI